jgi:hypothetical protein
MIFSVFLAIYWQNHRHTYSPQYVRLRQKITSIELVEKFRGKNIEDTPKSIQVMLMHTLHCIRGKIILVITGTRGGNMLKSVLSSLFDN